jgi:hypothetical protein
MKKPSRNNKNGKDVLTLQRFSRDVRCTLSEAFDAPRPERIVLAPGILNALQILFANMDVRRVMLSSEEYYGPAHLPAQRVAQVPSEQIVPRIKGFRPDVVIVSVVSWRGTPLPVRQLFSQIRKLHGGRRRPVLIADYSHAGAVGFPGVKSLGADLVCGDLDKWVTAPGRCGKLAFLWFKSRWLFSTAETAFEPFFLARDNADSLFASRWVDPSEIVRAHEWLKHVGMCRSMLLGRHRANQKFALQLASLFGISEPVKSNILWLPRDRMNDKHVRELERQGLVWRTADGRIRILCRADTAHRYRLPHAA